VTKLAYKPVGLLLGVAASALAGFAFKRIWRTVGGEDDAPAATDQDRGWSEILAAAALQGAIFALVKAAVDRAGAEGFRKVTGTWPA
jgi:Protein of unknown function (DUF4235)